MHIPFAEQLAKPLQPAFDVLGGALVRFAEGISPKIKANLSNDPLTGTLRPEAFTDHFRANVTENRRFEHPTKASVFVFMDGNGFGVINKRFNHAAGNRVLKKVGDSLTDTVRQGDTVGRLGGDEFGILYDGLIRRNEHLGIEAVLAKLATFNAVIRDFTARNFNVPVGFSMSMVEVTHGQDFDEVLATADPAMREIKTTGKDGLLYVKNSGETEEHWFKI